ncbi:winged helix DNA-binding domain-containing protein [Vagococcus sp. BWB3-3]|uniref:Winged helix DNA-binding domain-containing protein n=1 Tax=Vagococcus allomyrinae TaxID=2794353 RepID=A0A940P914_9ENTE|nr:crosslink repair DNA glycosylase YcaQ family protein [Vagococcus allomyrinae]MBP1041881.1 winged helix DNA-binding domain-containing protein [Vagococcus allomyrinae]
MTLSYHLTNQQARHLILLRQGLIGPKDYQGKTGTLNFIREIGSLQFDPIDICGRNADLTLLSRIAGYRKSDLEELLYTDRRLIDYFDKNLGIFPITEFQSFYYHKKWFQERSHSIDDIDTIRALITAAIKEKTYVAANDFDMNQKVDWDWGQNKLSRAALEYLYHSGELLIHHKDNTRKYYTLPEMVLSDLELVALKIHSHRNERLTLG